MSTTEDTKLETTDRIVAFRAPPNMVAAMKAAAEKQYSSLSDIARQSVAREMRERGLLTDER